MTIDSSMIGSFSFNDVESSTFKLICRSVKRPLLPNKKIKRVEVPSLSGAFDFSSSAYGLRTITMSISYIGEDYYELRSRAREISSWLSASDWCKLIINDEADKYYLAKVTSEIDLDNLWESGSANIVFDCQPFAYSINDERVTGGVGGDKTTKTFNLLSSTANTYTDGPTHGKNINAFGGGVLAPNGKVILIPVDSPNIGIYDPIANTYTDGPIHGRGFSAFSGGVLASNGKVILVPAQSTVIGIYDPIANTYTNGPGHGFLWSAFSGGALAPNGKVILAPYHSSLIGVYDPIANTYTNGPEHGRGSYAFGGGVLAPNGKVILIPDSASHIGIYDPITDTYVDGPYGIEAAAFSGGVLAPNGKVILVPLDSPNVGIYDPIADTYTDGPIHGSWNNAFRGGVLAPNGKVILVPYNSPNIGIYEPEPPKPPAPNIHFSNKGTREIDYTSPNESLFTISLEGSWRNTVKMKMNDRTIVYEEPLLSAFVPTVIDPQGLAAPLREASMTSIRLSPGNVHILLTVILQTNGDDRFQPGDISDFPIMDIPAFSYDSSNAFSVLDVIVELARRVASDVTFYAESGIVKIKIAYHRQPSVSDPNNLKSALQDPHTKSSKLSNEATIAQALEVILMVAGTIPVFYIPEDTSNFPPVTIPFFKVETEDYHSTFQLIEALAAFSLSDIFIWMDETETPRVAIFRPTTNGSLLVDNIGMTVTAQNERNAFGDLSGDIGKFFNVLSGPNTLELEGFEGSVEIEYRPMWY